MDAVTGSRGYNELQGEVKDITDNVTKGLVLLWELTEYVFVSDPIPLLDIKLSTLVNVNDPHTIPKNELTSNSVNR